MIREEEYIELKKRYNDGYRWIARDENGYVYVYYREPKKLISIWKDSEPGSFPCCLKKYAFPYIKWEDEKPTKINDLLRDYDSYLVITEGNNLNKAELVKEIEDILDYIGVSDYQLGECDEDTIWTISSFTIRKILLAIEKHSPVPLGENVEVTIPQFVADWIEKCKPLYTLRRLFSTAFMPDSVKDWTSGDGDNCNLMALAWIYGYEIEEEKEKEKLYTVRLANGDCLCRFNSVGFSWVLTHQDYKNDKKYQLTQSEIESVDPVLMQLAEEVE